MRINSSQKDKQLKGKKLKFTAKSAFSLIELSIVILIIGIIIVGVTQSSTLVRKMRLNSARSLTQSSSITSITGLSAWLETTMQTSLKGVTNSFSPEENEAIETWMDYNPQSSYKINLTAALAAQQPTYILDGINGIPALKFNGSSNVLISSAIAPITAGNDAFTIAVVWQANSVLPSATQNIVEQSATSGTITTNDKIGLAITSTSTQTFSGPSSTAVTQPYAIKTNYITLLVSDGINYYIHSNTGVSSAGAINAALLNAKASALMVGAGYGASAHAGYFNGEVSEVIMFDRALNSSEVTEVKSYLSKKYSIKTS